MTDDVGKLARLSDHAGDFLTALDRAHGHPTDGSEAVGGA